MLDMVQAKQFAFSGLLLRGGHGVSSLRSVAEWWWCKARLLLHHGAGNEQVVRVDCYRDWASTGEKERVEKAHAWEKVYGRFIRLLKQFLRLDG
jgi:hypothetical protein